MVCMSSASAARRARCVRKGSRLAGRLNTDWFVVFVETPQEAPEQIDAEAQRHLLANIETGARAGRRGGPPAGRPIPVEAILDFARSHGVGHIVVGRSHQPWWRQLLGRSVPLRLVREAQRASTCTSCRDRRGGRRVTLRAQAAAGPGAAGGRAGAGGRPVAARDRRGSAEQSRLILADNYRSVLAAAADEGGARAHRQRRALHRWPATTPTRGRADRRAPPHLRARAARPGGQHHRGGRERGDARAARGLERLRAGARPLPARSPAAPSGERRLLPRRCSPRSSRIKQRADEILGINQDAMVRKSDSARTRARLLEQLVIARRSCWRRSSGCSPPPG